MRKNDDFSRQVDRLSYLLDQLKDEQDKHESLSQQLKSQPEIPKLVTPPPKIEEIEDRIRNSEVALHREKDIEKYLTGQVKKASALAFNGSSQLSPESIREASLRTVLDNEVDQLEAKQVLLTRKLESLKLEIADKKAEMQDSMTIQRSMVSSQANPAASSQDSRTVLRTLSKRLTQNEEKTLKIKQSRDLIDKAEKDILSMKNKKVILEKKNKTLKKKVGEVWSEFSQLENMLEQNRDLAEQLRTQQTSLGIPYNPHDLGAAEIERIRRLLMGTKYKSSVAV